MIRFVDIDNSRVYNGDKPYVHWFEGQQSVDLIYTHRICVLTDSPYITVSIPHEIDRDSWVSAVTSFIEYSRSFVKNISKYVQTDNVKKAIDTIEFFMNIDDDVYQDNTDRCRELVTDLQKLCDQVYDIYKKEEDKTKAALIYEDWTSYNSQFNIVQSKLDDIHNSTYSGVFTLLDINKLDSHIVTMDNISYQDIQWMKCYRYNYIMGTTQYQGYYVYMLYFLASSDTAMEARQSFYINDNEYTIGADFYEDREELKIGLGNMGIEIPESVQRAIYPSNVHEEAKDDILMNRKYKELLMDYMDILGTRGNYTSLINSLNWFEYGDLLRLREFWRHDEWKKTIYSDNELQQVLAGKAKDILVNFTKTTYLGIYCAMQTEKRLKNADGIDGSYIYDKDTYREIVNGYVVNPATLDNELPSEQEKIDVLLRHFSDGISEIRPYVDAHTQAEVQAGANFVRQSSQYINDDRFIGEGVPALMASAYKWSRTDMAIKMALLGNFYETYFMPIHLDLIHSTIEDIVYTNAIKVIPIGKIDREDYVQSLGDVICNVKDKDIYVLGNVDVQSAYETLFSERFVEPDTYDPDKLYNNFYSFEVTDFVDIIQPKDDSHNTGKLYDGDEATDPDLRNFMINHYGGVGVIIPFVFDIPCHTDDVLKRTTISFNPGDNWITRTFNTLLEEHDKYIHVEFNMLLTNEQQYDIRFEFDLTCGEHYTKRIRLDVVDNRRNTLHVYKIKPLEILQTNTITNDYMFAHTRNCDDISNEQITYSQFIPRVSSNGIRLNHMIVIRNAWTGTDGKEYYAYPGENGVETFINSLNKESVEIVRRYYDIHKRYALVETDNGVEEDKTQIRYIILISNIFDGDNLDKYANKLVSNIRNSVTDNALNDLEDRGLVLKNPKLFQLVLRADKIYIPQYHYLEELDGDTLDDYTITDETLCVIPDIKYLKRIDGYEWIFRNASTGELFQLPSIKEPLIAPTTYQFLPAGFYDIFFRYRIGTQTQVVSLDSAFFQKR